jgi:hypothetical protein
METKESLEELAYRCATLKAAKDAADAAYKKAKSELETICDEQRITELNAGQYNVSIKKQHRFRKYRDENVVIQMIPEKLRGDVMSLDRKKVNGLVDAGILPEEIKGEEMYSEITNTTIRAAK